MDAKGRISLPSRFRDALVASGDSKIVITRGLADPCLDVYPMKRWEALERRVEELPRFDSNVVKFRRLYVAAAVECDLDGQGRLLVPPTLREHAALDKAVLWSGMIEKAELWSAAKWSEMQEEMMKDTASLRALGEELKL
jgi:MraZ protein